MLLTVSGPPGSGKSTNAELLAQRFDLDHISGGDIFRELAEERGYTPVEFNELAEEEDQIDRDLDRRLRNIAATREDVLLESRLAGWLAAEHADMRFWLDAPLDVRAERIADREDKTVEEARAVTERRERSEAKRYEELYDLDITDLTIYDAAFNTARWGEMTVPDLLAQAVERYDPEEDEGKQPVEGIRYDF
ncbi:(d)CMP kinase [Halolamina salifodinae]|uniref:Cytidylate kinase n=1 Tax=Halolamina salifodinae TaxID=1202767 RepID=A0A8T4H0T2_9EURY|nr:AAA family ATPase [Halolamina salifodinae]MBP1988290.1 cytidylate kinase [Halolamina salifodinae]